MKVLIIERLISDSFLHHSHGMTRIVRSLILDPDGQRIFVHVEKHAHHDDELFVHRDYKGDFKTVNAIEAPDGIMGLIERYEQVHTAMLEWSEDLLNG